MRVTEKYFSKIVLVLRTCTYTKAEHAFPFLEAVFSGLVFLYFSFIPKVNKNAINF